jgi:cysteinyl-tRNA synthetase
MLVPALDIVDPRLSQCYSKPVSTVGRIEWVPYLRTRITEYMDGRVQKFIEKLEEMGVAYESSGSAALLKPLLGSPVGQ